MKMPKVAITIVVPIYNVEKYLTQCLDSILDQTFTDFELILVDDGSTDGSIEIEEEFVKKDSRVKLIKKEHSNAGESRNVGLDIARGEYITFLDSDDFYEPDLLELKYNKIVEDKADICGSGANHFRNDTGEFESVELLMTERMPSKLPYNVEDCPDDIFMVIATAPWMSMYRTAFIKEQKIRYQSLPRANDVFFSNMAFALAERITIVDKVLVHHRVGVKTSLQGSIAKTPDIYVDANYAVKKELEKRGLYEKLKTAQVMYSFVSIWLSLQRLSEEPEVDLLNKRIEEGCLDELDVIDYFVSSLELQINKPERYSFKERDVLIYYTDVLCDWPIYERKKKELHRLREELNGIQERLRCSDSARILFPFEQVKKGSRVIIYGVGDCGQMYYDQIIITQWCDIIGFCDRKKISTMNGLPVYSVSELAKIDECEYIIVSVYDIDMAKEIVCKLTQKGIKQDRIICYWSKR